MSSMIESLRHLKTCTIIVAMLVVSATGIEGQSPDTSSETAGNPAPRVVRVGLYENKPKVYTDESGRPSGIFIDILNEIARQEGWELHYVPCEWSDCLRAVEAGEIDLMPDIAYSPERDRSLDFHREKVIESWSELYVHEDKPVTKLSDLDGRRIALLRGSIQQSALAEMTSGFGYHVTFVEADSYEEAFRLASEGAVDAVVSNHFFGEYYFQEYGLKRTAIVFNPVSLYFATAAGTNQGLLDAVDLHLHKMKEEPGSVYYRAVARWMERPPVTVMPRYIVWILAGIGGSLALAFVAILLLRRQVVIRTRHLAEANDALRESEAKYHAMVENIGIGVTLIEPDMRIAEMNRRMREWFPAVNAAKRPVCYQAFNDPARDSICEYCPTCLTLRDGGVHQAITSTPQDGHIRNYRIVASPVKDAQGQTVAAIEMVEDITEQRKLEEQYRQAQKMESVGRLAGGVAHDYNNMLSVILGYTELALERVEPAAPLHDDLTEILTAARRSGDITRQLLAFARKQPIDPKVLDLNEAVRSMIKMVRRLIGEDVEVTVKPGPDLKPVRIDPSQLEQILVNLCVNARDAIAGVGRITIETRMMTFDDAYCADHAGTIPGEFVMLATSDSGCGMDKETIENIFEPFFTTKETGRGTGLGLATVYGIVKQNGGFINVYSELGVGTTFKIYLPSHVGKTEAIRTGVVADVPTGRGELVLLVEDDPAILRLGQLMLERLGYSVLAAGTPDLAVRLAEDRPETLHLLITDVVMPGMNGRDLAEKLRALRPGMKVLFMSGYTADVIAQRGVLEDGLGFLQKPFSMRDLGSKMRSILDGV